MIFEDSRYVLADMFFDAQNRTYIGPRERFFFEDLEGNIPHTVRDGDDWHSLAYQYYGRALSGQVNLWWGIADFQPEPVLDPTLTLQPGTIILIPPLHVLQGELEGLPDEPLASL